jgi:type II secretory pathway pseudopilin PulG
MQVSVFGRWHLPGRKRESVSAGRKCSRGFTLPEGLFGMAIMGVVFVTLYTGMTTGFQSIRRSRENLRATQILMERFETIRLYDWAQINRPGFIPTNFIAYFEPRYQRPSTNIVVLAADDDASLGSGIRYTGTVTIAEPGIAEAYSNELRKVTVELAWSSNGRPCRRTYSSYVARYGLQRYVY